MPNATLNYDTGWPYLDGENYLDVLDDYSVELKNKIKTDLITRQAQDLTLGSGWAGVAGSLPHIARIGKTVYLTGLIQVSGSPAATLAGLPAWATPAKPHRITAFAAGNKAIGQLTITTTPAITYDSTLWTAAPTGAINLTATWEAA